MHLLPKAPNRKSNMTTVIGLAIAAIFIGSVITFVYKQGQNTAKLQAISEEVKKREKQEQYAAKIKSTVTNMSVDDVRGRLRKIKR